MNQLPPNGSFESPESCTDEACWAKESRHVHSFNDRSTQRKLDVRVDRLWREGLIELAKEDIEVWTN